MSTYIALNQEEKAIISYYTYKLGRASTISQLQEVAPHLEDPLAKELTLSAIEKLKGMTDVDFSKQNFRSNPNL